MPEEISIPNSPREGLTEVIFQVSVPMVTYLGMISHKKSLITIFGHKHFKQKFHQKFEHFHKKFSTPSDFGSYFGTKLQILKQNYFKNEG